MKQSLICAVMLGWIAVQAGSVAAVAQEHKEATKASQGAAEAMKPGIADGASSPDEMGNRRPLYRLQRSDMIEIKFTFAPEFNQNRTGSSGSRDLTTYMSQRHDSKANRQAAPIRTLESKNLLALFRKKV